MAFKWRRDEIDACCFRWHVGDGLHRALEIYLLHGDGHCFEKMRSMNSVKQGGCRAMLFSELTWDTIQHAPDLAFGRGVFCKCERYVPVIQPDPLDMVAFENCGAIEM